MDAQMVMDAEEQTAPLLAPTPENLASVKVFPLIPHLKKDITATIDSALSWEQLTASDINFAIVRPLVFKYSRLKNMAVVYACLVVRSYFLSEADESLAYAGVMLSRATLCEIMAMKLTGTFAANQLQLVAVLTTSWNPLSGAPPNIVQEVKQAIGGADEDLADPQSALEMAITTEAKAFLSAPAVQAVVNDIYVGRVVFSMAGGHRSMLLDNYKPKGIEIYDSRKAPFLNHYRLRVPKYGAILEFLGFAQLLAAFLLCLATSNFQAVTVWEVIFIICALAFALEEWTASKEHGWIIYFANMWNVFDSSFIVVFIAYLVLRIKGLIYHDAAASALGFDILACGACILFPRLAFFMVSNNVVVLALRAMISDFIFFIGIACICFSGLLFTLSTLAGNTASTKWTVKSIAWLMVQIWFGNTYLSFGQAESFHPIFGPILMTGFAALSNTLLLTILISILSNTFARIDANASREYLFQFTISTIEGVKADALFSYHQPFNLLAFILLKPASWVLSPRSLHRANVLLIKVTSLPILVVIGVYERYFTVGAGLRQSFPSAMHAMYNSLPRNVKNLSIVEAFVGTDSADLLEAIFEVEVSHELELFEDDSEDEVPALRLQPSRESIGQHSVRSGARKRPSSQPRSPRRSPMPYSDGPSPHSSPRRRMLNLSPMLEPTTEVPPSAHNSRSPLAQLFGMRGGGPVSPGIQETMSPFGAPGSEGFKRIEGLLEDIKDLPIRRLKEEMKELQDRQARIENLLLMLTRGMRNEAGPTKVHRHDSH